MESVAAGGAGVGVGVGVGVGDGVGVGVGVGAGGGATKLFTRTVTSCDEIDAPLSSRPMACSVCRPSVASLEFHAARHEPATISLPTSCPSI